MSPKVGIRTVKQLPSVTGTEKQFEVLFQVGNGTEKQFRQLRNWNDPSCLP